MRLAVLASSSVDHMLPALHVAALRRNFWLDVYTGDYGRYSRDLVDRSSDLHDYKPDRVLFAMDTHHLLSGLDPGAGDVETSLARVTDQLIWHWRHAHRAFKTHVVQQTVLPIFPRLFGNNEHRLPGSLAGLVGRLNAKIRMLADAENADLLSIDARAAQDGIEAWFDQMLWYQSKQEIRPGAVAMYADLLVRVLAARQARSFKCLVLDLDNTLWGGAVRDVGVDGIELGTCSAMGEAFADVQSYARSLSRRGISLAICTRNEEASALAPFENHPDMVLERDDIACFAAGLIDTAPKLRNIAAQLSIGLESLVFVSGNPDERDLVRRELPDVAVPELPEDPGLFPRIVADAGYFEAVTPRRGEARRARCHRGPARKGPRAGATVYCEA
jgi:predicted enzyme involved in methoxymalonyl-ACP biosynthesis